MTAKSIDTAIVIFLSIPVVSAAFVSWAIVRNLQNIGVDGWKRLFALNKTLINFYITVFVTSIVGARYIEILGDQLFVALLVACAAALGIKIHADMKKKED